MTCRTAGVVAVNESRLLCRSAMLVVARHFVVAAAAAAAAARAPALRHSTTWNRKCLSQSVDDVYVATDQRLMYGLVKPLPPTGSTGQRLH